MYLLRLTKSLRRNVKISLKQNCFKSPYINNNVFLILNQYSTSLNPFGNNGRLENNNEDEKKNNDIDILSKDEAIFDELIKKGLKTFIHTNLVKLNNIYLLY